MLRRIEIVLMICLVGGLLVGCAAPAPTIALTATPAPTVTPAPTMQPGDVERKVMVGNLERSYLLHIPPGVDSLTPMSVVFFFHWLNDGPAAMQSLTGLDEIADTAGFLVVYPVGIDFSWNAGGICCGNALTQNVDEPAFIRQILADLATIVSVDVKRVYASGVGHGAAMVFRLGCEMPDTFAAIAPVAGTLAYSPCQAQQPISLLHVHGTSNPELSYAGGGLYNVPPTEEILTAWAKLDGCADAPQVTQENIFTHKVYGSCTAGYAVELYLFDPGGASWPSKYVWPASQTIWDFFAAHPKP